MKYSLAGKKRHARDLFRTGYNMDSPEQVRRPGSRIGPMQLLFIVYLTSRCRSAYEKVTMYV